MAAGRSGRNHGRIRSDCRLILSARSTDRIVSERLEFSAGRCSPGVLFGPHVKRPGIGNWERSGPIWESPGTLADAPWRPRVGAGDIFLGSIWVIIASAAQSFPDPRSDSFPLLRADLWQYILCLAMPRLLHPRLGEWGRPVFGRGSRAGHRRIPITPGTDGPCVVSAIGAFGRRRHGGDVDAAGNAWPLAPSLSFQGGLGRLHSS